jgi:hypothetical protein
MFKMTKNNHGLNNREEDVHMCTLFAVTFSSRSKTDLKLKTSRFNGRIHPGLLRFSLMS